MKNNKLSKYHRERAVRKNPKKLRKMIVIYNKTSISIIHRIKNFLNRTKCIANIHILEHRIDKAIKSFLITVMMKSKKNGKNQKI